MWHFETNLQKSRVIVHLVIFKLYHWIHCQVKKASIQFLPTPLFITQKNMNKIKMKMKEYRDRECTYIEEVQSCPTNTSLNMHGHQKCRKVLFSTTKSANLSPSWAAHSWIMPKNVRSGCVKSFLPSETSGSSSTLCDKTKLNINFPKSVKRNIFYQVFPNNYYKSTKKFERPFLKWWIWIKIHIGI